MKKRYVCAFFITALLGTLMHFGYTLLPSPLTGLVCPINESVWEHLKLLYFPVLITGFYLHHRKVDSQRAWSGTLLSMLLMPAVIVGFYYTMHCGFLVSSAAVDIASYYVVLALGFYTAYKVERSGKLTFLSGLLVILVGLLGAALILFTLVPPDLPIFTENLQKNS